MLPRAVQWADAQLPRLESIWDLETSPIEQLAGYLDTFCAGDPLAVDEAFKCLQPHDDGIWELKTADLRLFGWFYRRDTFIWSAAGRTEDIKLHDLYHGYMQQAVRDREALDLDPPPFVTGDHTNVISAWY